MTSFDENYRKKIESVKNRIKQLIDLDLYIEVFFWFTNIIEAQLTILLSLADDKISCLIDYHNFLNTDLLVGYKTKTSDEIRNEKLSIGKLIERYSKYSIDTTLLSNLNLFVKLRNKIVHNIFEDSNEIGQINKITKTDIDLCWNIFNQLDKLITDSLLSYLQLNHKLVVHSKKLLSKFDKFEKSKKDHVNYIKENTHLART